MATVIAKSGATREISDDFYEPERIVGLDEGGRVVIDSFDAFNSEPEMRGPYADGRSYVHRPFLFGLTLCCNASDTGIDSGIVCRGCYGFPGEWVPEDTNRRGEVVPAHYADAGNYLYKEDDGTFPGLDPLDRIEGLTTTQGASK